MTACRASSTKKTEAMIEALIAQALQDGKDYTYEHRIRAADGRLVWLRVNASVVLDDAGEPAFIRTRLARHHRAEAGRSRAGALALAAAGDARRDRRRDPRRRPGGPHHRQQPPVRGALADPAALARRRRPRRPSLASVLDRLADPDEFVRRVDGDLPRTGRSPPTTSSSWSTAGRSSATRRRSGSAARSSAACGPSATSPRSSPRNGR